MTKEDEDLANLVTTLKLLRYLAMRARNRG